MIHPDYDYRIARQEIDSRLRESMKEYELRQALPRSPGLWDRIAQQVRRIFSSIHFAGQPTRREADCLDCG